METLIYILIFLNFIWTLQLVSQIDYLFVIYLVYSSDWVLTDKWSILYELLFSIWDGCHFEKLVLLLLVLFKHLPQANSSPVAKISNINNMSLKRNWELWISNSRERHNAYTYNTAYHGRISAMQQSSPSQHVELESQLNDHKSVLNIWRNLKYRWLWLRSLLFERSGVRTPVLSVNYYNCINIGCGSESGDFATLDTVSFEALGRTRLRSQLIVPALPFSCYGVVEWRATGICHEILLQKHCL